MIKYRILPDEISVDIEHYNEENNNKDKCEKLRKQPNGCGGNYLYINQQIQIKLTIYHLIVAILFVLTAMFYFYSSLTAYCSEQLVTKMPSGIDTDIDDSDDERARIASCDSWISSNSTHSEVVQHCPPEAILFPCTCLLGQIQCYNLNVVDLKPIFKRVATYIERQCVKQRRAVLPADADQPSTNNCTNKFIKLELDGLDVRYLEENFVYGLSFEIVALKNLKQLTRIERGAFKCSSQRLKQLSLEGETSYFLTDKNLPQLASVVESAPKLIRLFLDAYHLKRIPSFAFNNSNLEDVSFNFNRQRKGIISLLDNDAFFYLDKLTAIDLYEQHIRFIPEHAFRIRNDRPGLPSLSIYLQDNGLRSDSFHWKTFRQIGRSLFLYLEENSMTYIDRNTFEPFFQANKLNMVNFSDNPLKLECRNMWISKLKTRYEQILSGHVNGDRLLVNLDPIDYTLNNQTCSLPENKNDNKAIILD